VEPSHAIHGKQQFAVRTREPDFVDNIAHSCGYVFNIGGKRILEHGDSVLTEEHLNLKNIDVLFVSPKIHNMYTDRSMILINRLQPSYIFPRHPVPTRCGSITRSGLEVTRRGTCKTAITSSRLVTCSRFADLER
jgi:hypothetical protein